MLSYPEVVYSMVRWENPGPAGAPMRKAHRSTLRHRAGAAPSGRGRGGGRGAAGPPR